MTEFSESAAYVDGHFVGQKWVDLAVILRDYSHINNINPPIKLKWIPPNLRMTEEEKDAAYAVVHERDGREYIITYAAEDAIPEHVLAEVFSVDMQKGNVQKRLEAKRLAYQIMQKKREEDEAAEKRDLARFLISENRNWKKIIGPDGDLIKLDSNLQIQKDPLRKHIT